MSIRKRIAAAVTVALSAVIPVSGHASEDVAVNELVTKPLQEFPGKEVLMITVTYAPGAADPVHRHDAHGFIYVLQGSIVMQVKGGKEVTLSPGDTFYEGPHDLHIIGRNASKTVPAKFLVVLVKNTGAPVFTVE
ncbi:cupin domain-containing protein [Povalibacter sp.]|uniref:cupin domain-containing protein n=1 Tax=Povalibacter sp. TaxID=1962978 RepID=UPI002F403735